MKYFKSLSFVSLLSLFGLGSFCSADTVGSFWGTVEKIATVSQSFVDVIEQVFGFIRSIIKFIYFGGRTILYFFNKLFVSFGSLLGNGISYLYDMFDNLSIFLGGYTIYFVGLFVLILVILFFQFLIRLFTMKYHISHKK